MVSAENKGEGATCLICNCERTMTLDGEKIANALGRDKALTVHSHLCRSGIASFETALSGDTVLVACTQEAPLFSEVAEDAGFEGALAFANIRETAGWSKAKSTDPKVAALLASALVPTVPAGSRTLTSQGVCLVIGAGQVAIDAAARLANRLSVSLVLSDADDIVLPTIAEFLIAKGTVSKVTGHLGAFSLTVDRYAPLLPSSRSKPTFVMPRDGARSQCDIIVDLTGGRPLVTAAERRDGYLRADPSHPASVQNALFDATDLVGEFEKPNYVFYAPDLCAHSRNAQVGCTNCLDSCPVGAVSSIGDHVSFDPGICGGCGGCVAACPSGAVSYAYPSALDQITRIQAVLKTYRDAGGKAPVILFHDETHGIPLIGALARYGDGLAGNIIPIALHSATSLGHETLIAALSAGAHHLIVLAPPKRTGELDALRAEVNLSNVIVTGLAHIGDRITILTEDDPDRLAGALDALKISPRITANSFTAAGTKREIARAGISKLLDASPDHPDIIALPDASPYGQIDIDGDGCTLCLACVSACPVDALLDSPDRPEVRFIETACVQCGICQTTCPENVITLEPRLNLLPEALQPRLLNADEPFHCIECNKPFGSRKTVEHITGQLEGKHSMFAMEGSSKVIQMCDDCRIIWQANQADNPFAAGKRPRVRTTADYLAARDGDLTAEDFLKEK